MKLPDDDELYEVDQTYLGPPGRYIAEMRHRTIFAFLLIAPLTGVLLRKIGVLDGLLPVGLWLIACIFLSQKVADHTSGESPVAAGFVTFWHELTAPRPLTKGYTARAGAAFSRALHPRRGWAKAQERRAQASTEPSTLPVDPAPAAQEEVA